MSLPLPTDHFHARHDGAGRVGAVCGDRDEADVAVRVAVAFVVATDGQETCELAVCACDGGMGRWRWVVMATDDLSIGVSLDRSCGYTNFTN